MLRMYIPSIGHLPMGRTWHVSTSAAVSAQAPISAPSRRRGHPCSWSLHRQLAMAAAVPSWVYPSVLTMQYKTKDKEHIMALAFEPSAHGQPARHVTGLRIIGESTNDITWSGWMPMNWSFQRLPAAANGYVTSKWALRVHWNGDALRSVLKVVHMHCEEEGFVEDWRGARLHVRLQMQTLVPPLLLKLEDGQANDDEEWFNVEAVDHASISIPVLWTGHQYAICRGAGVLRC